MNIDMGRRALSTFPKLGTLETVQLIVFIHESLPLL
jgi:hypothetical protein